MSGGGGAVARARQMFEAKEAAVAASGGGGGEAAAGGGDAASAAAGEGGAYRQRSHSSVKKTTYAEDIALQKQRDQEHSTRLDGGPPEGSGGGGGGKDNFSAHKQATSPAHSPTMDRVVLRKKSGHLTAPGGGGDGKPAKPAKPLKPDSAWLRERAPGINKDDTGKMPVRPTSAMVQQMRLKEEAKRMKTQQNQEAIDGLLDDLDQQFADIDDDMGGGGSTQPVMAVAAYEFQATKTDEVTFSEGDRIKVLMRQDPDWWKGECNGVVGWFPSNHVTVVSGGDDGDDGAGRAPSSSTGGVGSSGGSSVYEPLADSTYEPLVGGGSAGAGLQRQGSNASIDGSGGATVRGKGTYAFSGREDDELTFEEDDLITIVNQEDDDWWEGIHERSGKQGWFPANHVKLLGGSGKNGNGAASVYESTWGASTSNWESQLIGGGGAGAGSEFSGTLVPAPAMAINPEDIITTVSVTSFEKRTNPKFYGKLTVLGACAWWGVACVLTSMRSLQHRFVLLHFALRA